MALQIINHVGEKNKLNDITIINRSVYEILGNALDDSEKLVNESVPELK